MAALGARLETAIDKVARPKLPASPRCSRRAGAQ
jgi:hypothetical protein